MAYNELLRWEKLKVKETSGGLLIVLPFGNSSNDGEPKMKKIQ